MEIDVHTWRLTDGIRLKPTTIPVMHRRRNAAEWKVKNKDLKVKRVVFQYGGQYEVKSGLKKLVQMCYALIFGKLMNFKLHNILDVTLKWTVIDKKWIE